MSSVIPLISCQICIAFLIHLIEWQLFIFISLSVIPLISCQICIAFLIHLIEWQLFIFISLTNEMYAHSVVHVVSVYQTQHSVHMMTSSNGNIFRVTGPLCGEFTGPGEFPTQRPVTQSFDVFFDLRLNKRLSKQPWGWWFETSSWSLWRQWNATGANFP